MLQRAGVDLEDDDDDGDDFPVIEDWGKFKDAKVRIQAKVEVNRQEEQAHRDADKREYGYR